MLSPVLCTISLTSRLTRADQKFWSFDLSMRCSWRPLPVGSICRSNALAFTAFWSSPDSRLNDAVNVSAMRKFTAGLFPLSLEQRNLLTPELELIGERISQRPGKFVEALTRLEVLFMN